MSEVMWSALAQYPNPGQGFSDAFQGGMAKNAINALMQNPNDPKALAAYGQYDPKGALNYSLEARKTQADLTAKEHKAWTETIGRAALWADTPEKRDQVVDYFIQQGHPEAAQFKQIPTDQWPAVRHALIAQAGLTEDRPSGGQMVPFTPGGGVARYDPTTGQVSVVVQPNRGEHPTGAPVAGPLTDEQMQQLLSGGQSGATPTGNF